MTIRPVTTLADPALPAVLDIYQKSFPLEEQMLVSFFLRCLSEKEHGMAEQYHFVVAEGEERAGEAGGREVLGFAFYELSVESPAAGYLWYLAVAPEQRGGGIGKTLYQHVLTAAAAQDSPALCFEIECDEEAEARAGAKAAEFARWRKRWYQRLGARELAGTHYLCGVGWQPAIPMQVMVHPLIPLSPEEALELAREALDSSIEQVGTMALVS